MNENKHLISWKKGEDGAIDLHCIHFTKDEFNCDCNVDHEQFIDKRLVQAIERIRAHFGGKPIKITSGYRCKAHNEFIGGATHSQHLEGKAADIQIVGVEPFDVACYALTIGLSAGFGKTFAHVDVRENQAWWRY